MKKKYFLLLFLMIGILPKFVFADACSTFKGTIEGGKLTINAIAPDKVVAMTEENDELHISKEDYIRRMDSQLFNIPKIAQYADFFKLFNSDYTKFDVYLTDGAIDTSVTFDSNHNAVHSGTKCTLDVEWATYDNAKGNAVLDFIRSVKSATYYDMNLIKHHMNDYTRIVHVTSLTNDNNNGSIYSYIDDALNSYVSYVEKYPNLESKLAEHITYDQNAGIGYPCSYKNEYLIESNCYGYSNGNNNDMDDPVAYCKRITTASSYQLYPHTNICSDVLYINVYYDGILYNFLPNSKFYTYPVFYIPEFTKNDIDSYLEAARERASYVSKNAGIVYNSPNGAALDLETGEPTDFFLDQRKSMIEYGKQNNYIDKNLNSTFNPLYVILTLDDDKHPLYILIAKAPEEKVLAGTSKEYQEFYREQKAKADSVVKVPDTSSFSPKSIIIYGIITLLIGFGIIYKVTKKTTNN